MAGAGAIGGYFGARLAEKGEDITFLVRSKRKEQLMRTGLNVQSVHGDVSITPKLLTAGEESDPFDVIIISTKSYQLEDVMEDIKPYAAKGTVILPLLNGIEHITKLTHVFGDDAVIGGLCFIETTLNSDGTIVQTSPIHELKFGERNGAQTERINRLEKVLGGTKANITMSSKIIQDMWHKYSFITAMSGVTTLMRSAIGPIREQESGCRTIQMILEEIYAVMLRLDAPVIEGLPSVQFKKMLEMDYGMKSSMQRDMEKSSLTETDHLQGYLLQKAQQYELNVPLLNAVYTNVKLYEAKR
ncbi:2-dehydropantoate 2-reductase [Jeotgalibacillus campisalis]|uniref:2-dehydropantoate 2-reductase n=2 Tax=Jeotgalibacillus campisalis TaxID=220754 RepID=A0A0C2REH1_9BACL|nr:2-dehydropantoate 2-reductase [Jeotgalibacillus campisalis]